MYIQEKKWLTPCSDAHLMPRVAQVVSIGVGDHDESLNGVNVLLLHLCDT